MMKNEMPQGVWELDFIVLFGIKQTCRAQTQRFIDIVTTIRLVLFSTQSNILDDKLPCLFSEEVFVVLPFSQSQQCRNKKPDCCAANQDKRILRRSRNC